MYKHFASMLLLLLPTPKYISNFLFTLLIYITQFLSITTTQKIFFNLSSILKFIISILKSMATIQDNGLTFKATELRLGLPGTDESVTKTNHKRRLPEEESGSNGDCNVKDEAPPAPKGQVVGWPPIRSYRKNSFVQQKKSESESGIYVKVSMDGAPYLRKIDLKVYKGYQELLKGLETMFKLTIGEYSEREGYNGSEFAPTYEDKDGDWMLVGDVPWDMFMSSCKRLRIMKGSEARGLGCGV